MKALVLGLGLQGRAVIHDLEQNADLTQIVAADLDAENARAYVARKGYRKVRVVALNALHPHLLAQLLREAAPQVLVCMLPPDFQHAVARSAIDAGVHFVSSSYPGSLLQLDGPAKARGVVVLPEMGMDPGIDLILGRLAVDELDAVHGMRSYGAGLPEPACAADNPIRYKITWTFEGVLKAYMRPARFLKDGKQLSIPAGQIFRKENGHDFEVPGVGAMEAYYNGDALHYIEAFGLGPELKEMGRFAMRWPGHNRFWDAMADLGFLDETPIRVGTAEIAPRRFVVEHLTPRLQFRESERDMVVIRVEAWGLKSGRPLKVAYELIDYRDLATGLFAMNRTVGFTASIAAQMILSGKIRTPGLLTPVRDAPHREVLSELEKRGMQIRRRVE
ncbi:MAG: saccharopine dehydrogenase NADP-binding domain-containing protein [Desulfobacterales bacterium]|jgi:saccharopine dehydrogenase-like NADP-dependent oxidoreductase|nr:saccharopine dehydrogenase NADP-binding domain-containing protein [Desulfobacterales bacterium]